jgi:hypothetical protein
MRDTCTCISIVSREVRNYVSANVSCCSLMYMNGTHQDTIRIHAGYIEIHQDTYPIGTPPPKG